MWKQIEGFDNYEVSDMGQVRNKKSGRVLKQGTKPNGYNFVLLGRGNNKHVHRLVAQAFLDNVDNLPEVHHIDSNKSNNCVENLRWISHKDNVIAITKTYVSKVIYVNGVYYESHAEASRRTGVPVDSLNRAVRNGKTDLNGFNLTY